MKMKIKHNFMYGTAWKEEKTENLVLKALNSGFTAIDTANQRKHYNEEGVGNGITSFLQTSNLNRTDLFLQTKFTFKEGQDHRLPYDPKAKPSEQVEQSFQSSLGHLKTEYIDSYVLHGPSTSLGLYDRDFEVWKAMESLVDKGKVKYLGISNINANQLQLLLDQVNRKPLFVQNRCFARYGWDKQVRNICNHNNIIYQGFSLLTANREILRNPKIIEISRKNEKTIPQIIFSFAQHLGMLPLTGTSDPTHMRQDLESNQIKLDKEEVLAIETVLLN